MVLAFNNTVHQHNTAPEPLYDTSQNPTHETVSLFNLTLVSTTRSLASKMLIESPGKNRVCFINAHCANQLAKNDTYANAVHSADYRLPDGSGMDIAARLTGQHFEDNLNGTDMFPLLLRDAERAGKSVFFLGAVEGNARGTSLWARRHFKNLKIAGTHHGYFDKEEEQDIIDLINRSGADILFVAMGVPEQDIWLQKNWDRLNISLGMGVGGLFEYYSGKIPRAPEVIRNNGLEWIWRFAQEPKRLFKRYVLGNPEFLSLACVNAFQHWQNAFASREPGQISRRIMDLALATILILCLSPILALLAGTVSATSKGPAFFTQKRIGLNGKSFKIFKFRSMYLDAEERRAALIGQSEREGICYKMKDDPRVTPIGKFIRRFSLDELPQLFNVFTGDMSIVGPRPALACEVDMYTEEQRKRLDCKPGITGLWQISGRANIPFEHQADMDIAYSKSRSVISDFLILLLTPWVVLTGRGAY